MNKKGQMTVVQSNLMRARPPVRLTRNQFQVKMLKVASKCLVGLRFRQTRRYIPRMVSIASIVELSQDVDVLQCLQLQRRPPQCRKLLPRKH